MYELLIIKQRGIPKLLLHTEALNRRLAESHTQKLFVNENAIRLRSGFKGERAVDFFLDFLPYEGYYVFNYLRIPDEYGSFQLDTFILTPYFGIICEIKNVFGTVKFDAMGQVIRTVEEHEEGFSNPIEQVTLQKLRLQRWLRQKCLPPFPIERLVVYSSPRTILKNITNNPAISDIVIQKESLISKIDQFSHTYTKACLTNEHIKAISTQLLQSHTPPKDDVLASYKIPTTDLLKGVFCPACSALPMKRIYGKWLCDVCGHISKNAHLAALEDYQMLIRNTINNRDAREFLHIKSEYVTKSLLQAARFVQIGTTSARKYRLDKRVQGDQTEVTEPNLKVPEDMTELPEVPL